MGLLNLCYLPFSFFFLLFFTSFIPCGTAVTVLRILAKRLKASNTGNDPVSENVQLPQSYDRTREIGESEKQRKQARAHFLEVISIGMEGYVGNHVDHGQKQNTKMPHATTARPAHSPPLTTDVVIGCCRGPDTENK